ncbi:MAG: hypothetical protein OEM96_08815 [Gemmatimonadota bacterium]|nr:hypothetical protein [Gemmatimonadota bacterium]
MSDTNDTTAPLLNKAERKAISAAREKLDESQKHAVIRLFRRLLDVRELDASAADKLRKAIPDEQDAKSALDALQSSASQIKDLAWDDRTWPARVGIGAATVVAATVAGQGAGLALLGTAIAIPLWVVFGNGNEFAAALVADLEASLDPTEPGEPPILEAEFEVEIEGEASPESDVETEAEPELNVEPEDLGEPQPEDRDLTKLFYEIRDRGEEAIGELRERGETFWQRINRETKKD